MREIVEFSMSYLELVTLESLIAPLKEKYIKDILARLFVCLDEAMELHIPWKLFRKWYYGQLWRRWWIDVIEIDVQEAIMDSEIPYATKQTPCVLDKKIHTFTCVVTSSIQEEDNV